eukprot:scaffold31815_cov118-Isochrysis_galbana.AAC.5
MPAAAPAAEEPASQSRRSGSQCPTPLAPDASARHCSGQPRRAVLAHAACPARAPNRPHPRRRAAGSPRRNRAVTARPSLEAPRPGRQGGPPCPPAAPGGPAARRIPSRHATRSAAAAADSPARIPAPRPARHRTAQTRLPRARRPTGGPRVQWWRARPAVARPSRHNGQSALPRPPRCSLRTSRRAATARNRVRAAQASRGLEAVAAEKRRGGVRARRRAHGRARHLEVAGRREDDPGVDDVIGDEGKQLARGRRDEAGRRVGADAARALQKWVYLAPAEAAARVAWARIERHGWRGEGRRVGCMRCSDAVGNRARVAECTDATGACGGHRRVRQLRGQSARGAAQRRRDVRADHAQLGVGAGSARRQPHSQPEQSGEPCCRLRVAGARLDGTEGERSGGRAGAEHGRAQRPGLDGVAQRRPVGRSLEGTVLSRGHARAGAPPILPDAAAQDRKRLGWVSIGAHRRRAACLAARVAVGAPVEGKAAADQRRQAQNSAREAGGGQKHEVDRRDEPGLTLGQLQRPDGRVVGHERGRAGGVV